MQRRLKTVSVCASSSLNGFPAIPWCCMNCSSFILDGTFPLDRRIQRDTDNEMPLPHSLPRPAKAGHCNLNPKCNPETYKLNCNICHNCLKETLPGSGAEIVANN